MCEKALFRCASKPFEFKLNSQILLTPNHKLQTTAQQFTKFHKGERELQREIIRANTFREVVSRETQ